MSNYEESISSYISQRQGSSDTGGIWWSLRLWGYLNSRKQANHNNDKNRKEILSYDEMPKSCMEHIFMCLKPLKCLKLYDKYVVLNYDLLNFILNCLLNFRTVLILFPLLGGGPANIQVARFSNQIENPRRLSNIFFLFQILKKYLRKKEKSSTTTYFIVISLHGWNIANTA